MTLDGSWVPGTHLILVHDLDEEGEGEADLCQLGDGHAVLGAVELGGIVVDVNDQDVEGRGDGGIRRGAVIIQLCALKTEYHPPGLKRTTIPIIAIVTRTLSNLDTALYKPSHQILTTAPGRKAHLTYPVLLRRALRLREAK